MTPMTHVNGEGGLDVIFRGAGGTGLGGFSIGGGNGDGDGDGTGGGHGGGGSGSGSAKKAKDKQSDEVVVTEGVNDDTTECIGAGAREELIDPVTDLQDASAYVQAIAAEPEINHIFKNSFYKSDPLPQWSFSVDFIPNEITWADFGEECFKTLTKAIISTKVNDYKVDIGTINYTRIATYICY